MKFQSSKTIRFHHCDPAGIVYFPQYLVLAHETIEDWFEQALHVPHGRLLHERGLGIPMVHLDCDYLSPARIGDALIFSLWVTKLGRSSFAVTIEARGVDLTRMRANMVMVMMELQAMRAVAIPDDLRQRMTHYIDA